jgi:hypothetical protein
MQNSTTQDCPRKPPLSDAERERVNRALDIAAIEQGDEAPPAWAASQDPAEQGSQPTMGATSGTMPDP